MSTTTTNSSHDSRGKPAHLFVLIHGLWGTAKHMETIEQFINHSVPSSTSDKIVTIKPSCFRFWKTYDGLELNSQRIVSEIFYEIESLKEKNNLDVVKISFVGYSLGGLISRYVIGLLQDLKFFDKIKPVFFTTFATPHVGIEFFNDNVFDAVANRVGPYLFGKSGGQLFISDYDKILVTMADPDEKFFQGLKRFEKHILLANIRNDRTVAFFTSYITDVSPFDKFNDIKVEYLSDLPQAKIGNKVVSPKFVDLSKSRVLTLEDKKTFVGNKQEETPFVRKNKWSRILIIVLLASFVAPFWIPLVLTTSTVVSFYSFIKIQIVKGPPIGKHWNRVKSFVYGHAPIDPDDSKTGQQKREQRRTLDKHESFKGDTSYFTKESVDRVLYAEDRLLNRNMTTSEDEDYGATDTEELSETAMDKIIDMNVELNDKVIGASISILKQYESFPLFNDKKYKLPLNKEKQFIVNNLNSIDWIKIPVYLDVWNAHDGIVGRRGAASNPRGASTIGLWASILRNHLKEESAEST
ncbi:LPL1 Lipid droplet phospholipase 1 [Candida maltosa Xu316]|uniref:DUF676 domain-containing protein n=1 Tax=Candida maltosa (strain Xu316) TaxID=1245528 RepID=M3J8F1_CANMX|nr:hypothetical protein G210_1056 [Candida maltosa Xu316]